MPADLMRMSSALIGADCRERFLTLGALPVDFPPLRLAGVSALRPPYRITRPRPGMRLVLATCHGRGHLWFAGAEHVLEAGSVFVAPPDQPHAYAIDGRRWDIVWMHLADTWQGLDGVEPLIHGWPGCEQLERAMTGAVTATSPRQATAWLAPLAALIDELTGHHLPPPRLVGLWRTVEERLHRSWDTTELAAAAGLSPAQLHRVCIAERGCSPGRVVTRLRLERARHLRAAGATLDGIATQVGYADGFALSKAWKRAFGHAPATTRTKVVGDQ